MSFYSVRESLTAQERRNRYNQLRDFGVHWSWAQAVRDWTHPHFERFLNRAIAIGGIKAQAEVEAIKAERKDGATSEG